MTIPAHLPASNTGCTRVTRWTLSKTATPCASYRSRRARPAGSGSSAGCVTQYHLFEYTSLEFHPAPSLQPVLGRSLRDCQAVRRRAVSSMGAVTAGAVDRAFPRRVRPPCHEADAAARRWIRARQSMAASRNNSGARRYRTRRPSWRAGVPGLPQAGRPEAIPALGLLYRRACCGPPVPASDPGRGPKPHLFPDGHSHRS